MHCVPIFQCMCVAQLHVGIVFIDHELILDYCGDMLFVLLICCGFKGTYYYSTQTLKDTSPANQIKTQKQDQS